LRAKVMARLAGARTLFGATGESRPLALAAIEMARRVGDKGALAYVLNMAPWSTWGPDRLEERLALTEELIRLAGEIGDQRLAAEGHLWKACHYLEIGDIAGADREREIQERFAETSRQPYHRWMAVLNRCGWAFLEARFEDADSLQAQAI